MMPLEVQTFPISRISFESETRLDDGLLSVDRDELRRLVLADPRIADVEIELVEPGEKARIIHFCDAVEPRIKIEGPGACYPGILGSMDTVGSGVTNCLRGMSVVVSAEYPRLIQTGVGAAYEAVLEMSGPGALSPLSATLNLVLALTLAPGHSVADYHQAVRTTEFKVAELLARTTLGKTPSATRHYELSAEQRGLPKVVYIHQFLTQLNLPTPYTTWYGMPVSDWMPFLAHPNEIIDGALLPGAFGGLAVKPSSLEYVHNPVVEGLYQAHGQGLEFVGVIIQRSRFEVFEEKQLSANQAAKLARLLGADGAIITWVGAGNAFIESMLTAQSLEREGIKAVLMTYEHGGKQGTEAPLMFSTPEADAIVSLGSLDRPITLPPVDRVIGGKDLNVDPEAGDRRIPADGEIQLDWYLPVVSSVDHWGFGKQICVEY